MHASGRTLPSHRGLDRSSNLQGEALATADVGVPAGLNRRERRAVSSGWIVRRV